MCTKDIYNKCFSGYLNTPFRSSFGVARKDSITGNLLLHIVSAGYSCHLRGHSYHQNGERKSGEKWSDPGATQTHDLQNRNLTLYSTKLRGQKRCKGIKIIDT